ncbi:MAG: hypothetical protein E7612_00085 [Ruminococcaceae bacterium]|nr:hypothetical protein [Oscillospiraceae bacterium]
MIQSGNVRAAAHLSKKRIILAAMLVLLSLNFALMGISLARYTTSAEQNNGQAGVSAFSFTKNTTIKETVTIGAPAVANGGSGEEYVLDKSEPLSMSVTNNCEFAAVGTVTLEYENILPLDYTLLINGASATNESESDNAITYVVTLEPGETVLFDLSVEWMDGFFDERLGGITETAYFEAVFEQKMGGA